MASQKGYIDLIDGGLKEYYNALKVTGYWDDSKGYGQFKHFCKENEITENKVLTIIIIIVKTYKTKQYKQ